MYFVQQAFWSFASSFISFLDIIIDYVRHTYYIFYNWPLPNKHMSISHNTICSTSSVISNSETFYYLLEWFEKPQRTQRDTEKKSNASLCPPCPLWLIFFAMINSSEYIKKSPNSPEIIYLFSSPAAFRARARSGHRQRGGCGVWTGSEHESRAPAAFFAALNPPPVECSLYHGRACAKPDK